MCNKTTDIHLKDNQKEINDMIINILYKLVSIQNLQAKCIRKMSKTLFISFLLMSISIIVLTLQLWLLK